MVKLIKGRGESWDKEWEDFRLSWFGQRLHNAQTRVIRNLLSQIGLPIEAKVLEIGCGSGKILLHFRNMGYKNSIGIDISPNSLKICQKKGFKVGEDVFLMDGTSTQFQESEFDLVLAEGVLEHFQDFSPFVREMARISKRYILLMQPDQSSLFRRAVNILRGLPVNEFAYSAHNFIEQFEGVNYGVTKKIPYHFHEQYALLFVRRGT